MRVGEIERISGPMVVASGIDDIILGEVVEVGEERLIGEVIRISGERFTVQVYENTSGLKPGEKIIATGKRLTAELGPGLITSIFDGVERPEDELLRVSGPFIKRGIKVNALRRDRKWHFKPLVQRGQSVSGGDIIGEVEETPMVKHRVMVPHGVQGEVIRIEEGEFRVDETIAVLRTDSRNVELSMVQEWPVRVPRPFKHRLPLEEPLVTGQRVIDMFFPIAKGGTAAIPGGFGTGKTITLHQLAKWSDADIVVYIGCGERGNEMCEVLTDFPMLRDPRTGRPLMERTVLIANTSNMPVLAREASIYMGVTIAEYYRDMGYHVAVMADSTSRWAEALREISGRLEEMPSERGFPAYLSDRIAEFYERAGKVVALGKPEREGSVSIIGAVSPPGGDFNEPVTIHTLRFTGAFWALDKELAFSRHFPAINWLKSYSLYSKAGAGWAISMSKYRRNLNKWWHMRASDLSAYREKALNILAESAELESIARIIGEKALPDEQRLILLTAELLKEGFLRQNAFDEVDSFCPPDKQIALLKLILDFHDKAYKLVRSGVPIDTISNLPLISRIKRVKEDRGGVEAIMRVYKEISEVLDKIAG
ncbi:V-type ATP synthase subunit A [Candidatus Bathyarchaeota archaeon]|nr:V-type ATP synthase subunit A [Candidatus Bathyarchaeota archaeon]